MQQSTTPGRPKSRVWALVDLHVTVLRYCMPKAIRAFNTVMASKKQHFGYNFLQTPSDPDQIWQTCTNQGATTFRKFWVPSAQWGGNRVEEGARTSPAQVVFLSTKRV